MTEKTKIINGWLPPNTKCPVPDCPCGRDVDTKPQRFSCALLRGHVISQPVLFEQISSDDPYYSISPKKVECVACGQKKLPAEIHEISFLDFRGYACVDTADCQVQSLAKRKKT